MNNLLPTRWSLMDWDAGDTFYILPQLKLLIENHLQIRVSWTNIIKQHKTNYEVKEVRDLFVSQRSQL